MKNLKISNELLSAVLGCKCEFIEVRYNFVVFTMQGKTDAEIYKNITYKFGKYKINLDTFLRIAIDEWALKENNIKITNEPFLVDTNGKYDDKGKDFHYFIVLIQMKPRKVLNKMNVDNNAKTIQEAGIKGLQFIVDKEIKS